MTLSEQDAYALRRAVSMLDVPTELKISPLVESLLSTLDWKNNPAHWSLLQQIVTHDPTVSAQILRVDPMRDLSTTNRDKDETFVPALAKSAQLSDKLIAATETVGTFHSDCMAWLSKRSPMTPRIFLESGPSVGVGTGGRPTVCTSARLRRGVPEPLLSVGCADYLLSQEHGTKRDHRHGTRYRAPSTPSCDYLSRNADGETRR